MKKTIQIKCKAADLLPYDSLIQFQGELKTLSKANLEKLKTRIVKRGFRMPFYIWVNNGENKILDGSQRDKVLKSLKDDGYEIPLLPVVYIEAESEQDAKETILEISSQYGEWNKSELEIWVDNIDSEIKDTLRFVDREIDILFKEETLEDDEIPEKINSITKSGDLWELGNHRLLCGNSTKSEDMDRLICNKEIDSIITSPPYSFNKEYEKNITYKEHINIIHKVIKNIDKHLINGHIIWQIANVNPYTKKANFYYHYKIFEQLKYKFIDEIVWYTNSGATAGGGKRLGSFIQNKRVGNYHPNFAHENIYVFRKGNKRKDKINIDITREELMIIRNDVWEHIGVQHTKEVKHPAAYPIKLVEKLVKLYCYNINIDPFIGSGSTLIASEKTNRICYGMEIEPSYCDVTINRYIEWCEKNNIKTKIKLNGQPYEHRHSTS